MNFDDIWKWLAKSEQEQSAWEREEKEQEREAGESVIVREIRLQQERERELRQLRQSISSAPADPTASPVPPPSPAPVTLSPAPASPAPASPAPPSPAPQQQLVGGTKRIESPARQQPPRGSMAGTPVGYEAAISTFAHAGENLIAREIAEQKAREDAVRQHWKELGMDVPLASQDSADTPFNRPDPHPAMNRGVTGRGGMGVGRAGGTYVKEVKPYKAPESAAPAQQRRGSVESEDSSKASSGERLDSRPKVQPYVDEDEEDEDAVDNRRIYFQPQNETPVEREIRLARERDEALQLERGVQPADPSNTAATAAPRRSNPPPAQRSSSNNGAAAGEDKHAMKRFAASRLHFEMERDKQRELQMKGEGKISTTSQDRTAGQVRYKDIISPDAGPPPVPRPSSQMPKAPAAITSEVRVLAPQASSPRTEPVKSEQGVRAPPQPAGDAAASGMVESLIEQELRMQREREEELRRAREQALSGRVVTNGDASSSSPGHSSPAPSSPAPSSSVPKSQSMDVMVTHREKSGGSDAALKTHRRKSALAEQWEKKFGATS